jgi:hypothetical protein
MAIVLVLATMQMAGAQKAGAPVSATPAGITTRGIGVYPGDPREDFAPALRIDPTTYRNLARHRPAYHSSSYDYNLTAQLVTDGIVETALPRWVVIASGQQGLISTDRRDLPAPLAEGPLGGYARQQSVWPKHKREWLLDGNWVTGFDLTGPRAWVQVELHGGADPLVIDRVDVEARVQALGAGPENWTSTVLGSNDGAAWIPLGSTSRMARVGGDIRPVVEFAGPSRYRYYRVVFDDPRAITWRVEEVNFSHAGTPVRVGGPHQFSSAWMSAGHGEEWVYVDLGAPCTFDRVALHWLARPSDAALQVSDDASNWRALQPLTPVTGNDDDVRLKLQARGRYVRVLMTKAASPDGYILSEIEVFGRGGPVPEARALAPARADGRLDLAGGRWRLQRDSQVTADGTALATSGFQDGEWLIATVPATVLSSYYNAGALPDPNFGDNQLMISDAFFHADFWYRTEFDTPHSAARRTHWLNFDGINRNADVFLNGEKLGRIEGGFVRARFDVTSRLVTGRPNALAVRIEKNSAPGSVKEKTFEHPDTNGGSLGADNPTYHASIGWDWIPTIRGRNTGIWNDVYLTNSGPVTIEHPSITSTLPLPDTTSADVRLTASVRNHDDTPVSGRLRGRFGEVAFDVPVTVPARGEQTVTLDPANVPGLRLANPRLWWPNGYGAQNLYDVELQFETSAAVSDTRVFRAGVRQFTHTIEGGTLAIWINGRRFIPRGGNWGFPESMLRYRGREYDAAVRYHKDLNFNMIRNWVGQTGDDEFYDACDRYGIVVWQDFWLANPWDGPDPQADSVFMANATDLVNRVRTHPSVGLYCGRNEGYPPKPLDDAIRALLAERHPDVPYISSSADDVASGHGPYRAMTVNHYFLKGATTQIHSEMGMPNIMTIDSLKAMLPEKSLWPLGRMYGLHDFALEGAQGGASFLDRMRKSYGAVDNVNDWATIAQFVNYEGYRAMYEAQSRHRQGLLIWMSHPAWPSLVWQTYDYYFEPTAGYFGAKKGAEPLHIQWNPTTEAVEVVNYNGGLAQGLTASAQLRAIDGTVIWEKSVPVDSTEDSTRSVIEMEYPLGTTPVHFIRLELKRGAGVISENFYWRGLEEGNFQQLRELPKVPLDAATNLAVTPEGWRLTTEIVNLSAAPAIMVRLKVVRAATGDRILPALYSDNYVAVMPGERRTITTEVTRADARGELPRMVVEGFNTGAVRYAVPAPAR